MWSVQVVMVRVVVVQERIIEEWVGEGLWLVLANLFCGLIWLYEDGANSLDGCLAFIFRSFHCLPLHFPSMVPITPILPLIRLSPALFRKFFGNPLVKPLIKLLPFLSDDPMREFVFCLVFLVIAAALCWWFRVDKGCHFFKERIRAG